MYKHERGRTPADIRRRDRAERGCSRGHKPRVWLGLGGEKEAKKGRSSWWWIRRHGSWADEWCCHRRKRGGRADKAGEVRRGGFGLEQRRARVNLLYKALQILFLYFVFYSIITPN
uniref:Uncharacterized protein n=1 Tax=Opuntia streptacantha TaxID=393608 RepID=A0A7C9DDK6_OPUST